jgi:hypothetical protein
MSDKTKSVPQLEKTLSQQKRNLQEAREYASKLQREMEDTQRLLSITKPLIITDHFLLRYLERACGIDITSMKQQLLEEFSGVPVSARTSKEVCELKYNGHKLKIANNTLITYLELLDKSN